MENRYYLFGDVRVMSFYISGYGPIHIGAQAIDEAIKDNVDIKFSLLKEDLGITTLDEFIKKVNKHGDWVQISEDDYNNLIDHAS